MSDRDKEIGELRRIMGTEAETRNDEITTLVSIGSAGVSAQLVDYSVNPYRAIFDMATATWGNEEYKEKWNNVSLTGRRKVLEAALTHQCLTTCLEAPSFTFRVTGTSRSAFDQIARVRIGAGIGSMGVRDNSRLDGGFRIPRSLWEDEDLRQNVLAIVEMSKAVYQKIIRKGKSSWQDARAILPMGMTHHFYITINYLAFQNQCARRLQFCEQPDTVAAFWIMRHELEKIFPVLAAYCRPQCDIQHKCGYHQEYTLSELFSCLFDACGRWPVGTRPGEERPASYFKYPSCTADEISKDLNIEIPQRIDWDRISEEAWTNDKKWKE